MGDLPFCIILFSVMTLVCAACIAGVVCLAFKFFPNKSKYLKKVLCDEEFDRAHRD